MVSVSALATLARLPVPHPALSTDNPRPNLQEKPGLFSRCFINYAYLVIFYATTVGRRSDATLYSRALQSRTRSGHEVNNTWHSSSRSGHEVSNTWHSSYLRSKLTPRSSLQKTILGSLKKCTEYLRINSFFGYMNTPPVGITALKVFMYF